MSEKQQTQQVSPVNSVLLRNGLVAFLSVVVLVFAYRFFVQGTFIGDMSVNRGLTVDNGTLFVDHQLNRVGVNTKTPTQTLDVNGTIVSTTLNATTVNSTTTNSTTVNSDNVLVSDILQIPIDSTPVSATQGAIQFSTATNSLQVYKTSGWEEVGGKIPIAETDANLVQTSDDPLILPTLDSSFTTTVTVNSEATFNAATAAAAENTRIQLTANISCAATLTIPNKALWIDLNTFTLTVPIAVTASIVCQQASKNIYFSNGTIEYTAAGTTGSSASLISATNCFLYIRNVVLKHAEYAVTVTGNAGTRMTFYTSGSTYTMVKARSSNNNSYGPIGLFGMVTNDSYVYVSGCTFNTLAGDTFLNSATDRYIFRGAVRSSAQHLAGSCTITNCTIDPAHRMQAVFYSDFFSSTGTRGTFRLMVDKNTIGSSGTREQLVLLVGSYKVLNCFESIWMIENTFSRIDSNKGVMYVDSGTYAGTTDVYIFKNTIPTQKGVGIITFNPANYTRVGNTANIVTATPHNFTVGYDITITAATGGLSTGIFIIQTIVSPTEFTITDSVSGAASGTCAINDNYATSPRKFISKDGFVRGPISITSAYLQKYYV